MSLLPKNKLQLHIYAKALTKKTVLSH